MDQINESSSALKPFYLRDLNGDPLVTAQLTGLTLTLHDPATGAIINSRDGQDVLNTNDVTVADVSLDGETIAKVSWAIQPEDTPILDDTKAKERRTALFKFTWAQGQHYHAYEFQVVNLGKVPG